MIDVMLAVAAILLLSANLYATRRLQRACALTTAQKVAQGLIVWCIPVVGSALIIIIDHEMTRSDPSDPLKYSVDSGSGEGRRRLCGDVSQPRVNISDRLLDEWPRLLSDDQHRRSRRCGRSGIKSLNSALSDRPG